MTGSWWSRRHFARRTVIGLAVLGLCLAIAAAGAVWRASSILNRFLREWAAGNIAAQSGGVYRLDLGELHYDWSLRRVGVDSISLSTQRAINGRRAQSLPGIRLTLSGCTLSGIHFFTLVGSGGLIARSFGCGAGSLAIEMPVGAPLDVIRSPGPALSRRAFDDRDAFLVFQQGVRLPAYAPRLRIDRIVFPSLALDVRIPHTKGSPTRLQLERVQWGMADLVIDPSDTAAAHRPLFSRKIELAASNFLTHPDRTTTISVGSLRTSLTDSTVEIGDVRFAPTGNNAQYAASQRYRRDLIRLRVGKIVAEGIDVGAFVLGQGVWARRIEVDSFRIEVNNDQRLPEGPRGPPHRTPQRWIADLDETLSLDSLLVHNGEVVYREHTMGREHPGVFTFARIEAAAANVSHLVGRHTSGDPMTLSATAMIQNTGRLEVGVVVPLDAPQFDMSYHGTLGAMPVQLLNSFVVETNPVQIEHGWVTDVAFNVVAKNGVARGVITPQFRELAVSVTRDGSDGILGGGGLVSGVARRVATLASKALLRANNPDSPTKAPRTGTIGHTFTSDETLIAFLWSGVRDGLFSVLRK